MTFFGILIHIIEISPLTIQRTNNLLYKIHQTKSQGSFKNTPHPTIVLNKYITNKK